MYIKVDADTFVEVDLVDERAKFINRKSIRARINEIKARLADLPVIDNAFLLQWARENYEGISVVKERADLEARLEELKALIAALDAVGTASGIKEA